MSHATLRQFEGVRLDIGISKLITIDRIQAAQDDQIDEFLGTIEALPLIPPFYDMDILAFEDGRMKGKASNLLKMTRQLLTLHAETTTHPPYLYSSQANSFQTCDSMQAIN
uniref:AlNc14C21G2203 protein n=1 Tax=Albugo laibachii Nc14 TaxID=890382 RepID=F0W5N8_9STRA|nr:AlNc14C21G2203 [Albugo laibachii Nc14]|eukprot:CCA16429.1 AlNc14C21G2203 [Albugo laibachii Nc14]